MSAKEKEDIYQEANILSYLDHPNIIKFYQIINDTKNDYFHIIMEYADGGDLSQKIKSQKPKHFQETQIITWFIQICSAIKYLHEDKRILHRDIKSSNIFLTKSNQVKLGDFGIAKCLSKTLEKAKTVIGTPYYLSPEIINNEPYDYKSDIWSLGVLLYELLMMRLPFEATNVAQLYMKIVRGVYQEISAEYSKEMKMLVKQLLNVNSRKRPKIVEVLNCSVLKEKMVYQRKRGNTEGLLRGSRVQKGLNISNQIKVNENSSNGNVNVCESKKGNNSNYIWNRSKISNNFYNNNIKKNINNNQGVYVKAIKKPKSNNSSNAGENEKDNNNNSNNDNEHSQQNEKQNSPKVININDNNKQHENKNAILAEFMKNKKEKILHSQIISQSISDNIWYNSDKYSLFSNNNNNNNINTNLELSLEKREIQSHYNNINQSNALLNKYFFNCEPESKRQLLNENEILQSFSFDKQSQKERSSLYRVSSCGNFILTPHKPNDDLSSNNEIISNINLNIMSAKKEDNEYNELYNIKIRLSDVEQSVLNMDTLKEDDFISNSDIIEEEKDKDSLSSTPHKFIKHEDNKYVNDDIIKVDLDIPNVSDLQGNVEEKKEESKSDKALMIDLIKDNVVNSLGETFMNELLCYLKKNVCADMVGYSYDKLVNGLKEYFGKTYNYALINKAVCLIPDLQFLLISKDFYV